MSRPALFVQRDGSLLPGASDRNADLARLVPIADVLPALGRLSGAGYAIIVLDPLGSTSSDPAQRIADNVFLTDLLESQGAAPVVVSACAHAASVQCDCAFPGLGLLRDALANPDFDRKRSAIVGFGDAADRLAANAGLRAFLLDTGTGWADVAHELLDAPRRATVVRRTRETAITVSVDLDEPAEPEVSTGIGFFDHMLEQLGKHAGFALGVECAGDLEVDEHHTVEDVALALGEALRQALGAKLGIARYGFVLPMDEARAQVSLDLSGRPYFVFEGAFSRESVGALPTELVPHFFRSLSDSLAATLHISVHGENDHHQIEAAFKGLARTLRQAIRREGVELPSTKGVL